MAIGDDEVDRSQKEKQVEQLRDIFGNAQLVVVTHQSGLTVAESTDLRSKMYEAGASFKVTKNRLARLAIEGTKFAGLADQFTGPTAIAGRGGEGGGGSRQEERKARNCLRRSR